MDGRKMEGRRNVVDSIAPICFETNGLAIRDWTQYEAPPSEGGGREEGWTTEGGVAALLCSFCTRWLDQAPWTTDSPLAEMRAGELKTTAPKYPSN